MSPNAAPINSNVEKASTKYTTFLIGDCLYGIDVMCVQEAVKSMPITKVPLAPPQVIGLINLRGQVATAIGLREIFKMKPNPSQDMMNVVCTAENMLLSLIVDEVGDVIEVDLADYETVPSTIVEETRRFLSGVYKTKSQLLSVIDLSEICKHLAQSSKNV